VPNKVPPLGAVYHKILLPAEVAFKLEVKPLQTNAGVAVTEVGVVLAFTVKVAVA
jgi:hypothetical protein